MYYKNASVILLVYDTTNLQTFQSLNKWVEEIDKNLNREEITVGLIAHKIDLPQNQEVLI
jgi:GTPase SAR1 family protein